MKTTAIAILAVVLAAQPVLTTGAAADGWRRHHQDGWRQDRPAHRDRSYGWGRPYEPPVRHQRRDRTGDAVGAAVLGIGALIIGAAIADAARRERRAYD
jgi:hypothetical protein